jgi:hypothetical protein
MAWRRGAPTMFPPLIESAIERVAAMRTACLAGKTRYLTAAVLAAATLLARSSSAGEPAIVVIPERVELQGNFARAQLLVARPNGDRSITERSDDLTTQATYESSDPSVVSVSPSGQLLATGNGDAKIKVEVKDSRVEVPVTVIEVLPITPRNVVGTVAEN